MGGHRRVVVVAGAPGAGKATLIRHLARGDALLPDEVGPLDVAGFTHRDAAQLDAEGAACPDRIVLNYDLFRPMTDLDACTFDADPALDIVARAGDCTILTLWEPAHTLLQRNWMRRFGRWTMLLRQPMLRGLHGNLCDMRRADDRDRLAWSYFLSDERLGEIYGRWVGFVGTIGAARHALIRPTDPRRSTLFGKAAADGARWSGLPAGRVPVAGTRRGGHGAVDVSGSANEECTEGGEVADAVAARVDQRR